jgi:hypothetical protein
MSAYSPLSAGTPATASLIAGETPGHFQSDGNFAAAEKWLSRAACAARHTDRVLIFIALLAALSAAVPAICMALAGETPA